MAPTLQPTTARLPRCFGTCAARAGGLPNARDSSGDPKRLPPRRSSSQIEPGVNPLRRNSNRNPRIVDQLTPYSEGPMHTEEDVSSGANKPNEPHASPQESTISSGASQFSPDLSAGGIAASRASCSSETVFGPEEPSPESPVVEQPKESTETLYDRLAHALGLLSTDPSPTVAQHGKLALLASGFDISYLPTNPEADSAPPSTFSSVPFARLDAASLLRHSINGQGRGSAAGGPGSISSIGSSELQSARREPGIWSTLSRHFSSTVQRLSNSSGAPRGGPQQHPTVWPTPPQPHFGSVHQPRSPVASASSSGHPPQTLTGPAAPAVGLTPIITPLRPGAASTGGLQEATTHAAGPRLVQRPSSVIYKRMCQHFRQPMKLSKTQAPEAVLTLDVSPAHWGIISKIERKVEQKLAVLEALHARAQMCRAATQPRLSDNVQVGPAIGIPSSFSSFCRLSARLLSTAVLLSKVFWLFTPRRADSSRSCSASTTSMECIWSIILLFRICWSMFATLHDVWISTTGLCLLLHSCSCQLGLLMSTVDRWSSKS
jgi:hypothetical protein